MSQFLYSVTGFCCWVGISVVAFAQPATNTSLKFEVASLKLAPELRPVDNTFRRAPGGQRIEAQGVTLRRLIEVACAVSPGQVESGPAWTDRDRFDLEALAERPASVEELSAMLRIFSSSDSICRFVPSANQPPFTF